MSSPRRSRNNDNQDGWAEIRSYFDNSPVIRGRRVRRSNNLEPVRRAISFNSNSNSNSNSNYNSNANSNNKPHKLNKNVKKFINKNVMEANKRNIPASKRVYVQTNVGNNNKINHVYNKRVLTGVLKASKKAGVKARTPLKRKLFKKRNIKKYPPVNVNNSNSNSNN